MKVRGLKFVHETPTHFVLYNGGEVFHIAKDPLSDKQHKQLRNLPPAKEWKGYDNDMPSNEDMSGTDSRPLYEQPQGYSHGNNERFPATIDNRPVKDQPQAYDLGGKITPEKYDTRPITEQPQYYDAGGDVLDANARAHIAPKNFALSGGRYPIHDIVHARNALARVAQHGTPHEQSLVKSAVHRKFPSIGNYSEGGQVHQARNLAELKQAFDKFIEEEMKEHYTDGGEVDVSTVEPINPQGPSLDEAKNEGFGIQFDGSGDDPVHDIIQNEKKKGYARGGIASEALDPENCLNQYVPEKGIVGGTVKDGSDDEHFHFDKFTFDIERAREISKKKANADVPVSQLWIDKIRLDPEAALKSESTNPVFIAQIHTPDGIKPLLIDGNHRMYKAIKEGKSTIPAHVFTPDESIALMTDKYRKPDFNKDKTMEHKATGGVIGTEPSASPQLKQQVQMSKLDRDSRIADVRQHRHPAPMMGKPFHYGDGGAIDAAGMRESFDEGGNVPPPIDPDAAQAVQDSFRKATHYDVGGTAHNEPASEATPSDTSKMIDAHQKLVDHMVNVSSKDMDPNAALAVKAPVSIPAQTADLDATSPRQDIRPQIDAALAQKQAQDQANQPPSDQQATQPPAPAVSQPAEVKPASSTVTAANQPVPQPMSAPQTASAQPQSNLDTLLAQSQQAYEQLMQERHADDQRFGKLVADNKIDPNRFFNDQNLGQKIFMGLGIGLASVGAAVTHMPNQALEVVNNAINRDIDAQKANQSTNMNLWKMNHESLGDEMAATLQTRNQMLEVAKVKMDELMGNAPGPMAMQKAAALKQAVQLEQQQNNAAITQTKMKQNFLDSMMGKGNAPLNNGKAFDAMDLSMAGLMPPEQAEKEQASLEAQHAKVNAARNVFGQINRIQTLSNRISNPLQSKSDLDQLNAQLATIVQDADPSKRLTPVSYEQEIAPFRVKLTDDPTRVQHKLQGVLNIIKTHESAGTPTVEKYSPRALPNYIAGTFNKNQQALNWANQNPNDPRAQEIKSRLGVK